jgi:Domain of unknown function (DUF5658)
MRCTCCLVSLSLLLLAAPALCADADATAEVGPASFAVRPTPVARGPVLPLLYGTLAGLQFYDGWSTATALRRGAVESNPIMSPIAANSGALWAVKAGATMASIYAAERLWKQHRRVEAISTMVAVNGIMAAVAVRNGTVMRSLK